MSLIKNYTYNAILILSTVLFPLLTFPYISRVLKPEYLGKIAFVQSIASYFITLSLLGIPIYSMRELSKEKFNKEAFQRVFSELFIIGIIGSIISFILFRTATLFYRDLKNLKGLINIFSLQILFSFLNIDCIYVVLEEHKRRVIRNLVLRIIGIGLLFSLVKAQKDYKIYAYIIILPELFMRVLDVYNVKEYFKIDKHFKLKKHFKPLLILLTTTISISLYDSIDSTMLGILKNTEDVGIYASAVKMVRILIPMIGALSTVIGPRLIYSIKEKNKKTIFKNIDIFLDFNFILGIPIVGLLFILAKEIILVFSGELYIKGAVTMKVMVPIIIFISIGSFMGGRILTSNDLEKIPLKCNITALILNIGMNYFLIPKFGILGAGIATLLTEIINCILKTYFVKRILYKDYIIFTKERYYYLILNFIVLLFTYFLNIKLKEYTNLIKIILISSVYIGIYIIALILLKDKILYESINMFKNKLKYKKNFSK